MTPADTEGRTDYMEEQLTAPVLRLQHRQLLALMATYLVAKGYLPTEAARKAVEIIHAVDHL